MTLLEREIYAPITTESTGEEALIKEARRLRRRRWMIGCTLSALAVFSAAGGFLVASGPPSGMSNNHSNGLGGSGSALAAQVLVPTRSPDLLEPGALVSLPSGNLLILDSSRDQILELTPGGQVSAFAGDGRVGFSGDGGQARDAEFDFTSSTSGMAVTSSGTVDVLDGGNCQIRAIGSSGIIRTILRVPLTKTYLHETSCPITAIAVSPAGSIYLAMNSEIARVSSSGGLTWVAGAHGSRAYFTPSHVAFSPGALAFGNAGDLYIWNSSPKVIFRLTPAGKLTELTGVSYATQLTAAPDDTVLAGTHGGEIQQITSNGVRAFFNVVPTRVAGIHWGRDRGFQEDGIAVTKNGTIYVDNAEGNGYGYGTVLVRIGSHKHAALVTIRTPLAATLPKLGTPGFPASLYPAARGSRGTALQACPSDQGLEPFSSGAIAQAKRIATTYLSRQFAADIAVTDRSWWTADFDQYAAGDVSGNHTVTGVMSTSNSPAAANLARACGPKLISDSIAVTVKQALGSAPFRGTVYFLDRNGHALVYDVRSRYVSHAR